MVKLDLTNEDLTTILESLRFDVDVNWNDMAFDLQDDIARIMHVLEEATGVEHTGPARVPDANA